MDLFEQLNEKQLEAVKETEGYVRVIAGAGSGKTKLLVSRYAYLVKEYGIDSANILCVTFTNKAAGEMRRRIRELIGAEYDTGLICTYHGFCARLLREDPHKLFFSKGFQIIDVSQQKALLAEIYQKFELKLDHASFEDILKKIGLFKSKTDYVPRFCSPEPCCILSSAPSTQDGMIIEEYLQRQKATYALDFNDLMSFTLYLLENDSEVREKWQDRLNYIQVDEFQDSSRRELELVNHLSGKYKNLMIVGDPDQNIYEWRGSDVKLLVDFDKFHTPTQTIFLNRNYRSTPQILTCANCLIERNEFRLKKDLYTKSPLGAEVRHYHSKSDEEENKVIAREIRSMVLKGEYAYSDIAVLYRSGFLSRVVEKKLNECGIPYEIYGGVRFYQRMEIQDMIAYLKLIAFDDDLSLKRIINTPRRKFGRTKMAALESMYEREHGESLFRTLKKHLHEPIFSGIGDFVRFIESVREASESLRICDIVNRVASGSGYEEYIRTLGDEERLENLSEFKRIANEFEKNFGEDLTLNQFLQQIALQSGEDEDKPRDAVKLMTIHASKGLEFPVVFIVGFTEGIFPSAKTIEERKQLGLEEERRLCYVAITRAKERLYLMDSEGFSQSGSAKLPSRFLAEIGVDHYTRIGQISKELLMGTEAIVRKDLAEDVPKLSAETGSVVFHHAFGKGTIIGIDEKRGSYIVKFDKLTQTRNISREYFEKPHALPAAEPVKPNAALPPARTAALPVPTQQCTEEQPTEECEVIVEENEPEPKVEYEEVGRIAVEEEVPHDESTDDGYSFEEVETYEEDDDENEPVAVSDELKKKLNDSDNLWKRDDVPHSGWTCIGVTDLGAPSAVCEMCGYQIIRYVHHMVHPAYRSLDVGCICAGKMEGDIEAAKKREANLKNKQARRESFRRKQWRISRSGNPYVKIREHIVVFYKIKKTEKWKYSVDSRFCDEVYGSIEEATLAAFETLDNIMYPENR